MIASSYLNSEYEPEALRLGFLLWEGGGPNKSFEHGP